MSSEEHHGNGRRRVHAFIQESTALVWDAQDVVHLREKWRIMGGLIGALPSQPRQNAQLGLPLKLMPEETTLLLKLGGLDLLEYAPPIVTEEDVKQFNKKQEQDFVEQEQRYLERKKSQQLHLGSGKLGGGPSSPKKPKLSEVAVETGAKEKGSFSPMVSIPTVDCRPLLCYTHYDEWTFPANETEKLKYAVFYDLWLKGYYLTSGLKYGGDYLVYRDNPTKVHSDFIAIVIPWQQSIGSIVSLGRLGSKVKKNTLLCSVGRENGPVRYVTLQWSGIT